MPAVQHVATGRCALHGASLSALPCSLPLANQRLGIKGCDGQVPAALSVSSFPGWFESLIADYLGTGLLAMGHMGRQCQLYATAGMVTELKGFTELPRLPLALADINAPAAVAPTSAPQVAPAVPPMAVPPTIVSAAAVPASMPLATSSRGGITLVAAQPVNQQQEQLSPSALLARLLASPEGRRLATEALIHEPVTRRPRVANRPAVGR